MGGTLADLAKVALVLAGGCTSTAMIWAMHCQQTDSLVRFGGEGIVRQVAACVKDRQWAERHRAEAAYEPGVGPADARKFGQGWPKPGLTEPDDAGSRRRSR